MFFKTVGTQFMYPTFIIWTQLVNCGYSCRIRSGHMFRTYGENDIYSIQFVSENTNNLHCVHWECLNNIVFFFCLWGRYFFVSQVTELRTGLCLQLMKVVRALLCFLLFVFIFVLLQTELNIEL